MQSFLIICYHFGSTISIDFDKIYYLYYHFLLLIVSFCQINTARGYGFLCEYDLQNLVISCPRSKM